MNKLKISYCLVFFILSFSNINSQSLANDFTATQIDSIAVDSLASEGDIYHDNQNNIFYIGVSNGTLVTISTSAKTVVLNKEGGTVATANNTYIDIPLTTANIQTINSKFFTVVGTAEVRVLEAGTYFISSALSVSNMPSGNTKYILAMYINGTLRSYLTRGSVSLPSSDFWGASGGVMYYLNKNDFVNIRYVINAGGSTLNAAFSNIGITKL